MWSSSLPVPIQARAPVAGCSLAVQKSSSFLLPPSFTSLHTMAPTTPTRGIKPAVGSSDSSVASPGSPGTIVRAAVLEDPFEDDLAGFRGRSILGQVTNDHTPVPASSSLGQRVDPIDSPVFSPPMSLASSPREASETSDQGMNELLLPAN
jgi:hypothetical protein